MNLNDVDDLIEKFGADGGMTDEQMAQLLTGNGEIADIPTGDDIPGDGDKAKSEGTPDPAINATDGEKPVILAKDGVHTIEYEKLVEARDEAKVAKEQARSLQEQLSAIKAERDDLQARMAEAAKQDSETGDTAATDELMASFKEDYPEFYAVLRRETEAAGKAMLSRIDALEKMTGQLAPVIEKSQADADSAHFDAIRKGVDGYDQIKKQSAKVHEWLDTQPERLRKVYAEVLERGEAKEVIPVLNLFKSDTGFAVTKPKTGDKSSTDVDALIAAATQGGDRVPRSLSDIPTGRAVNHDEVDSMLEESSVSLVTNRFHGKTNEQIKEMLDRAI